MTPSNPHMAATIRLMLPGSTLPGYPEPCLLEFVVNSSALSLLLWIPLMPELRINIYHVDQQRLERAADESLRH